MTATTARPVIAQPAKGVARATDHISRATASATAGGGIFNSSDGLIAKYPIDSYTQA
jgi:hypothetical protein